MNQPLTLKMIKNRQRLLLLLGLLVAFALRLFHLGSESLWYDETVSVVLARDTLPGLIAHTARDIHPPAYYLLLHGWQWLVQPSLRHGLEFLYAWPSLCFGLLIVALLYPLARRLYQPALALLALWLAAVNPFQLWYSQEVRMYTMGGALGLLCLWALLNWFASINAPLHAATHRPRRVLWLLIYAISAALGLYTLYYFLFLIVALNLIAFLLLWPRWRAQPRQVRPALFAWLGAQLFSLFLYAPWLPILWRQATEPPVPVWRTPWPDLSTFFQAVSESLAALVVGQSPPGTLLWPWALASVAIVLLLGYANISSKKVGLVAYPANVLLIYVFAPLVCLYLVTLTVTPLYHVRYLFTYASPFMLLLAQALWHLRRFGRWLNQLAVIGVLFISSWGLAEFWFNPLYRTDDHRAAVAQLATQWRPGDLILVNAGWVYTALATYWPTEFLNPDSALPPSLGPLVRLTTYAQTPIRQTDQVVVARTGSVDGPASLGWGDPASDFYAMPLPESNAALARISDLYPRIWQYRLYDTVSDPQGHLRAWLDAHAQLVTDTPFPGRDYLRLQLYETYVVKTTTSATNTVATNTVATNSDFASALRLQSRMFNPTVQAGAILYVQTHWLALPTVRQLAAPTSFSLRLYDHDGQLVAQHDAAPLEATNQWQAGQQYAVPLALPIAVATKPDIYDLALIAYNAQTGAPLATVGADATSGALRLGPLQVTVAQQPVERTRPLATFDYIDLVTAQLANAKVAPTGALHLRLIWQPQPNAYRDTYLAQLSLRDGEGQVKQSWREPLGGWDYPSGQWPPGIPVQEWRSLPLTAQLPAGVYQLTVHVVRNSDQQAVPIHQGWWPMRQADVVIGQVAIGQ